MLSYFGGTEGLEGSLLQTVAGEGEDHGKLLVAGLLHSNSKEAATCARPGLSDIKSLLSTPIQLSFSLYLLSSLSGRVFCYFPSFLRFFQHSFYPRRISHSFFLSSVTTSHSLSI